MQQILKKTAKMLAAKTLVAKYLTGSETNQSHAFPLPNVTTMHLLMRK